MNDAHDMFIKQDISRIEVKDDEEEEEWKQTKQKNAWSMNAAYTRLE